MAGYMHDTGYNQRRMIAFAAIVALHVFIGWAFITGFGQSMVAQAQKILETKILKTEEAKETPPPPPKPDLKPPPPPSVPMPVINVNVPIDAPVILTTRAAPPPVAPRPVAVVASTSVKIVESPNCHDDYYPSQEIRLAHEGSAVVRVCFTAAGRVDKATPFQVISSSGFPALDEAGGKCMSAGRYKAATVEGKPVAACKDFKVTFKIKGET